MPEPDAGVLRRPPAIDFEIGYLRRETE